MNMPEGSLWIIRSPTNNFMDRVSEEWEGAVVRIVENSGRGLIEILRVEDGYLAYIGQDAGDRFMIPAENEE